MQLVFTPNQLAAMCQTRQRLSQAVCWGVTAMLLFCAASALYNVFTVTQPWMRVGQVWGLGVVIYLLTPGISRGPVRLGVGEPAGQFLLRDHEQRRRDMLWMRRRVFLLLPSLLFSYWGARQVNPQSLWWPFLVALACVVLMWFMLGKAAEKAQRDADEIRRGLAPN